MKDEREQLMRDIGILRSRLARYEDEAKTVKFASARNWYSRTIATAKRHIADMESLLKEIKGE